MQHQQLEAAATGAATEQHTVYPPSVLWLIRSEDDLFVHLPRLPAALLEQKRIRLGTKLPGRIAEA